MYDKMMVCLDGSDLAQQLLPYAKELALKCNSKVVLFQVIYILRSMATSSTVMAPTAYPPLPEPEEIRITEQNARSYLETMAVPLREEGLKVECVTAQGVPAAQIVMYSIEHSIDIIVIATHGRKGLGRAFLGSVADEVIRESRLPILVMRPQEE